MRRVALIVLGLAGLAEAAQAMPDERTQLDEFVLDSGSPDPRVDQIAPGSGPLPSVDQKTDRQVETRQELPSPSAPMAQLSTGDTGAPPDQLTRASTAGIRVSSVSTRADSRPEGAAAIAGSDRCDPRLDRAKLEECQRILERRAAEFDAPAPPVLSPEQRLLAEQDRRDSDLTARSPQSRMRLATLGRPDADVQSNQELAAIYLPSTEPSQEPARPAEDAPAETLGDILQTMVIEMQATGSTGP